jgi:predicted RecA/RadA family phage recombinase
MATRFYLTPESAIFPTSNFPDLKINSQVHTSLGFDAATSETAYWKSGVPQGWTGTVTAVITYRAASATSGSVVFRVAIEAITSGDAVDTDSSSSFDTSNSVTDTVPGTAGYLKQVSVTLTNNDSAAAGDFIRIRLDRDASNGSDTATGDIEVLLVEIRDSY